MPERDLPDYIREGLGELSEISPQEIVDNEREDVNTDKNSPNGAEQLD